MYASRIALLMVSVLFALSVVLADKTAAGLPMRGPNPRGVLNHRLRDRLLEWMRYDQELRYQLVQAAARNGESPEQFVKGHSRLPLVREIQEVDCINRWRLRNVMRESRWPGRSQVGPDAAHAAWLIAQHADADRAFQAFCLEQMKSAPTGEVALEDIVYLTDRVRLSEGKGQIYGTQLEHNKESKLVLRKVDHPESLNARRKQVGLSPVEDYIRQSEAAYQIIRASPLTNPK